MALVYAALTDKEAFWQAAKKKLPPTASKKDIITLQGEFENQYAKDEKDRLATLWNCFIGLQSKSICHTGIRNEFAMNLNGVYPDVWFIEDMGAFLHDYLTEHLHQQIDTFKENPALYRDIILAEMQGERLELLSSTLEKTKPKLEQTIKQTLVEHGINPQGYTKKINSYLGALEDISPSFGSNALMSSLSSILAPSFKKDDELLLVIKDWINREFQFNNEPHENQVVSFDKIQKTTALFKKYQAALRTWNHELITPEQLDHLENLLESYKKNCLQSSSPQPISEEQEIAIGQFEKACSAFKSDGQCHWIENFFIQWAMARRNDEPNDLRQLYSSLYDSTMLEKILVTDTFLEKQFPNTQEEIEITPYLINRLFLHATTVHPKAWTNTFSNTLERVYDFVANELTNQAQDPSALALKRDSYPEGLLRQLKYLQEYYQYLREDHLKQPENIDFYLPMKQFILTVRQFIFVTHCLPSTQKEAFMASLDNEFLQSIIKNSKDLIQVVEELSETQKESFMNSWGDEFLQSIIKNTHDLSQVATRSPAIQAKAFMASLSNQFLQSFIKNSDDLGLVVHELPGTQKDAFITYLSNEFFEKEPCSIASSTAFSQKTKAEKQQSLINYINNNELSLTKLSDLYNKVQTIYSFNEHRNVETDRFFGIKNTTSWQSTLGVLRNKALVTLFTEVDAKATKEEKLELLSEAKKLPLFQEHRSNSFFAGAWGSTASVKKIEEKEEEINVNQKSNII